MKIVYKIHNKINNKTYIGITTRSMSQRWAEHCYQARSGSKYALHRAIRKYGQDSFCIESIDEESKTLEELYNKEADYIRKYKTFNNHTGYNCTSGGEHFVMTSEERLRRSKALLGRKLSDEIKQKISETRKKTPFVRDDEYRKRISKTSKGRVFSENSIEKRAKKLRGQKRTQKQRQKMRKAALGRKSSEATKKILSEAQKASYKKRLIPFDMYKNGKFIGRFLRQKDFCDKYDVSNNSLGKLLSKRLNICKGYSGYYITRNTSQLNF